MKSITLIHKGKAILHKPILNDRICIGTSADSDLVLDAAMISEQAITISRDSTGRWHSKGDLQEGGKHRILGAGTRIPLGDLVLEFRDWPGGAARTEPPRHRAQTTSVELSTILGNSRTTRELKNRLFRLAPLREPVLILGETGTGKELAARAIHELSPVAPGPFIPVNCGALNESLVEDVLFGHEKGSFTGAGTSHRGVFEQADGGTLFLDEIGELPMSQQAALLRVLDGGAVSRIGSERSCKVSFRLVAATNRDLSKMVSDGTFRLDLFHRIATLTVKTPPLRARHEDIALLADSFLAQIAGTGPRRTLSQKAVERLMAYGWPGNIRELKNVLLRAWALGSGNEIEAEDLEITLKSKTALERNRRSSITESMVSDAMQRSAGNITAAARELGIPRTTMRNRLHQIKRNAPVKRDESYSVTKRETAFSREPARS